MAKLKPLRVPNLSIKPPPTTKPHMNRDIDISAGNVIEGTETIDEVGERLFQHIKRVASGEILARAEENKHREFQFWAEQTVSL